MKTLRLIFMVTLMGFTLQGCNQDGGQSASSPKSEGETGAGQSAVEDDQSQKDVVKIAVGSKDHTTLVKALSAADLVNVLANAGPFTVFAPTNAAFDQLPAGTLDNLLKKENVADLKDILEYHVFVGVLKPEMLTDGRVINQVNLGDAKIKRNGEAIMINDANVSSPIPASNGIVYIIDKVLLPPKN